VFVFVFVFMSVTVSVRRCVCDIHAHLIAADYRTVLRRVYVPVRVCAYVPVCVREGGEREGREGCL